MNSALALTSPGWRGAKGRQLLGLFAAALAVGGMTTAFALWLISGLATSLPHDVRSGAVVAFAVAAAARDLRLIHFRLPENHRQVPRAIFQKGPIPSFIQFGFALGTGVRTRLPATTAYVAALALVLISPGLALTLLAGALFGLGRWLMPVSRKMSADKHRWDEILVRTYRSVVGIASVASAGAAIFLALT